MIGKFTERVFNTFAVYNPRKQITIKYDELFFSGRLVFAALLFFTALISGLIYYRYGVGIQAAGFCIVVLILEIAVVYDLWQGIIPDKLILTGVVTGTIVAFINPDTGLLNCLLGAGIVGGALRFVSAVTKEALGMGDVKLFTCTGLFLGLEKNLSVLVVAMILCGLTGIALIIGNPANRKKEIPFAPFILMGVLISMF